MIETADALAASIIATALWPQDEQSITDWLYENVKLDAKSPIQGPYDIEDNLQLPRSAFKPSLMCGNGNRMLAS